MGVVGSIPTSSLLYGERKTQSDGTRLGSWPDRELVEPLLQCSDAPAQGGGIERLEVGAQVFLGVLTDVGESSRRWKGVFAV